MKNWIHQLYFDTFINCEQKWPLFMNKPRLSNDFIDYHAIGMVRALQKAGHTAYLVGGCVRDLLAGHIPKDFDIGTSALPQEVRKILSFSFIIGKRFRLVLVKREDKQYEVATFRREPQEGEFPEGAPFGDNIFGTPEQDAFRRDFTCNALFFDPIEDKVIDYVGGKADVENHVIRMIGDPQIRLAEDPIRILRALRFSHKLHFRVESALRAQMHQHSSLLANSVLPRRREEYLKLLRLHSPSRAFREGYDLNLWKTVLSEIHSVYEGEENVDLLEDRLIRLESQLMDSNDTPLLWGTLVLGWLRARNASHSESLLPPQSFHTETFNRLTKEQLGMHAWEISRVQKALALQKVLSNVADFKRKGARRRHALIFSEAFPLALDLAHIDGILDPTVLEFWDEQVSLAPEPSHINAPRTRDPRGRRRRRRSH
ncbi:MAG: CCA tRNA nucleotidyltransferase [Oligoflexia bacterium]|nr:CCA tRNA nucleotidyltransferase [Oligoflexia bacterium]